MSSETSPVIVERLSAYAEQDAVAIGKLLPHLSEKFSDQPIDKKWLEQIIASPYHDQIVARIDGKIVGAATLNILFVAGTGQVGYLESFVVDPMVRGRGIGDSIWQAIDTWCREKTVKLEFTSHPKREAAHRFYKKHGAVTRDTTVFRYTPAD